MYLEKGLNKIDNTTPHTPPLRPYQVDGVQKLISNFCSDKPGFLLKDEPGLGKSRQVIEALKAVYADRVTIVAPASLLINWRKEFEKWGYLPSSLEIVSFNYCQKKVPSNIKGSVLVIDEAHFLRNIDSKQSKNICEFASKAKKVWMLTGTPVVKGLADTFNYLLLANPKELLEFRNFYGFADRYAVKKITRIGNRQVVSYISGKNVVELRAKFAPVSFGRKKADVLKDLPEKEFFDITLNQDMSIGGEVKFTEEEILRAVESGSVSQELMSQKRISGINKTSGAANFINSFKEPVVVFAQHQQVVKLLSEGLVSAGKRVGVIKGGMSAIDKDDVVTKFQGNDLDVVVCNIEAAGVGLTLTAARVAVFVELPFNFSSYIQACDRIHRIGQENKVQIYNLLNGELDEMLVGILKRKRLAADDFDGVEK